MRSDRQSRAAWPRRRVLGFIAATGAGSVFGRALVTMAQDAAEITPAMISQAEWISGVPLDDEQRELMLEGVNELIDSFERIRDVEIDNGVPPALFFRPRNSRDAGSARRGAARALPATDVSPPRDDTDIAFASVARQGRWLREGKVTSTRLTRIYLDRLQRHDPTLECVITLLEPSALQQAARADEELKAGRDRGPLHGIPWGAKDLLAVPGAPTTWGATPFRDQVRPDRATVVQRLEQAGAVLLAKLSLGALAWGDVWYGGRTRNPWNPEQGSSGSSAGSAAAAAAGLAGFTIGSETWGSIVSPCTRCGATGLRPTFGRVSRHGAMALSWSMDKLGPIGRSVEDCALVLDAIHGRDGLDATVEDHPFEWPHGRPANRLRVGYVRALFDEDRAEGIEDAARKKQVEEAQEFDRRTLQRLREIGVQLFPIELPDDLPVAALSFILTAEAATAFDDLTRSGRVAELKRQVANAWPNVFRQGQLIPAVEYLRANRIRTRLIETFENTLSELDAYVTPAFGGDHLLMTNLTGHPAVVLPNGFRQGDGTPTSITFGGPLFRDDAVLSLAHAYQTATDFHLRRPPGFADEA